MSQTTLVQGDCLEKLKELPDNSIDSIVTDPPYELGFMGKSWDSTGIANDKNMWAECLRVLKPGGHLLAFSGTRTYHRMAVAIEDAGFEVRDMIEWVYGCLSEDTEILTANGWKMLYSVFEGDYVFACDYKNDMKLQLEQVKQKFIYDYDEDAYHIKDTGYYNSELMETDHIVSKNHNVLVLESWVRNAGFGNNLYWEKIPAEKLYENIQKIGGKKTFRIPGLNGDIPCTIKKIPYKGKVWCVEVESGAFVARRKGKIFITGNSGFPKSLNIGKAVDKLQGNEREDLGVRTDIHSHGNNCRTTEVNYPTKEPRLTKGTSEWEGWGTALKPAHEPICMARKPLAEKTVAENCLKYGTGGINIDESRVGLTGSVPNDKISIVNKLNEKLCQCNHLKSNVPLADKRSIQRDTTNGEKNVFSVAENVDTNISERKLGTPQEDTSKETTLCLDEMLVENTTTNLNTSGSGNEKTEKSLKDTKSTISTENTLTTDLRICSVCGKPTTSNITKENILLKNKNSRQEEYSNANAGNVGRFPSNLIHDNSEEVRECFPEQKSGAKKANQETYNHDDKEFIATLGASVSEYQASSGNASRFFKSIVYQAKASKSERNKGCEEMEEKQYSHDGREKEIENPYQRNKSVSTNNHPTVKPIALMEYLIKMVTPRNGTVLDPFMGSGSTGVACKKNGYDFIGIEMEAEYIKIAESRISNHIIQSDFDL